MNARIFTGLCFALLILSGCAASSPPIASSEVTSLTKAERYQAAVNAQARLNGAEVHWVNLPDENDLARYADSDSGKETANGSE